MKAVNQALEISKAPYVCILNNDTLPGEGWLNQLVDFAERHPDVGLLNPLCKGHVAKKLTINGYAREIASDKDKYMEMNQCQGYCMLIKRDVIKKIGYLDDRFGLGGFDDTDYSMRAHLAGYRSVCVHSSYVYHREHKSFTALGDRKKLQGAAEREYFKKWPRHQRIAVIFSVSEDTGCDEIKDFLNSTLSMARRWCWTNLLVFGGKGTKDKIDSIKQRMNFPQHQNIKFNYLSGRFKMLEIAVRILERSFGRKRRKKYDAVISEQIKPEALLRILCKIQGCKLFLTRGRVSSRYYDSLLRDLSPHGRSYLHGDNRSFNRQLSVRTRPAPEVDIILPVCDQYEFTRKCIESIIKNTDTPYRLIIINNGRNPETRKFLDMLDNDQTVETSIVHNDHNIGWVKALNRGIGLSRSPYVCFQNDDTIVTRGWLRKMIRTLNLQDNFGMINPSWEGRPRGVSIDQYNAMLEKNPRRFLETDWCRGFSVVVKRAVIEKIGNVDEVYGPAYFDDVDYSVTAIEAGFLCLRALDTYVYHHRNVTFFEVLKGKRWSELHEKNKHIYYKRWGRPLKIAIILNKEVCKDKNLLNGIEETVLHLARKQHRVDIWSPQGFNDKFLHTNIRLTAYHPILLKFFASFSLYLNAKKRTEKRYNAVFTYDKDKKIDDFNTFIKESVDKMKEKTKEHIHV